MTFTRRDFVKTAPLLLVATPGIAAGAPQPFGTEFPQLESLTTGEWWTKVTKAAARESKKGKAGPSPAPSMNVPREEVVCFAYYTQQNGVLKLSAQLFPLKPEE